MSSNISEERFYAPQENYCCCFNTLLCYLIVKVINIVLCLMLNKIYCIILYRILDTP